MKLIVLLVTFYLSWEPFGKITLLNTKDYHRLYGRYTDNEYRWLVYRLKK